MFHVPIAERATDPARPLLRALLANAAAAGCPVRPVSTTMRDWASATFVGAQHRIVLAAAPDPALSPWLAGLAEAELSISRHILGDLVVDAVEEVDGECHITLSALTLLAS